MRNNKILIIGPNTDMSIHGGIVTHMKLLLSLNGENDFKFELKKFTVGERKKVGEKISIYNLLTSYLLYVWTLLTNDYDVVHINSSMKNGSIIKNLFVLLISKLFFKKCIFQFHGGEPDDISKKLIFILNLIVQISNKILVLTDEQREICYFLKKSQWHKIKKIPNFIEKKEVDIEKSFTSEQTHFLFVGRIIREKGVFEIVEASQKLVGDGLNFKVSIMGDGSALNELKTFVESLNIEKYFIFHGFITDDKIKNSIYTDSDVMVFPSYYKEGFPYTILEAMQFSMPIISTGVGALSSVIENKKNGFLIDEKNSNNLALKMKYFILNNSEIKRMGLNSLSLINKKYSLEKMKDLFSNLYKEIL